MIGRRRALQRAWKEKECCGCAPAASQKGLDRFFGAGATNLLRVALPPNRVDAAGNRSLSGAAVAARGRRGSLSMARPAFALILMGDWCASFKVRHKKPDDAGALRPLISFPPSPVQRA